MLVLTRKPGEQIMIGGGIRITVVSVGHGRVKIGVEAPPSVTVDRQEVFDRKQVERAGTPAEPLVLDANAAAPALHNRIADRLPTGVAAVVPHRGPDPRKPR
jgi:carbon storage regulator